MSLSESTSREESDELTDSTAGSHIGWPAAVAAGALMGGADAIPGVSGGTIALILGIYERFIGALATVIKAPLRFRDPEARPNIKRALKFLIPLGIGLAAAYLLVTKLLVGKTGDEGLLIRQDTAPLCYGFFFGLVFLSLREPWRRIQSKSAISFVFAAIGAGAAYFFSGLPYAQTAPETWMLLFGGAGAITVMLLPGVSGSLLLVILGQYQTVVRAVHDRNLVALSVFFGGIVLGVILFVPLLRKLLRNAHDATMAVLTGLMLGSLRALWPWKSHYKYDPELPPISNQPIDDQWPKVLLAACAAAVVLYFLHRLEKRLAVDQ